MNVMTILTGVLPIAKKWQLESGTNSRNARTRSNAKTQGGRANHVRNITSTTTTNLNRSLRLQVLKIQRIVSTFLFLHAFFSRGSQLTFTTYP